jgi:hypothetical protein
MPFLGRTSEGGPFQKYYDALSNLGADFVRFAPWCPYPKVVVTELTPPDCTATKPSTNWNSTLNDAITGDFMTAVCGPNAAKGECKHSVAQQLSTMPAWLYIDGYKLKNIAADPWQYLNTDQVGNSQIIHEFKYKLTQVIGAVRRFAFDCMCGLILMMTTPRATISSMSKACSCMMRAANRWQHMWREWWGGTHKAGLMIRVATGTRVTYTTTGRSSPC